ncbi:signal recognition particle subunit SRP72 [Acrasis kona]|uniref:Signal recognition particle subunit SRP72 n=1 Tax=Acrasis kona TaxID=1008807 RepID=A0AAW2Z342_9EUKA
MTTTTPFAQLQQYINDAETKNIIKTCDRILKNKEDDDLVQAVKFIALIQDNEFQKALSITEAHPSLLKDYSFAEAYCLYRIGSADEAMKRLEKIKGEEAQHLKAQIEYKLGNYEKASKLYESFTTSDEILTNLSAAYTLADQPKKALDAIKRAEENTHELAYNGSCASIDLKDYEQARRFLDLATKLCKDSLDSEYTEEEIQEELTPIRVQTAYLSHLVGDVSAAENIYESVLEHKKGDAVAVAVAANNLATIQSTASVFESAKKMKLAATDKVQGKLTTKQQRGVDLNHVLVLLLQKKFEECRQLISQLPLNSDVTPLMLSALLYQEKNFTQAIETLKNAITQDPNNLRLKITLAQILIQRDQPQEAAQVLSSSSIRHEPAVVSLLVKLTDDVDVLNQSVEHWKSLFKNDKNNAKIRSNLVHISRAAADLNSQKEQFNDSAQVYETLVSLDPNDKYLLAYLVDALSYSDVDKAKTFASKLPKMDVEGVNAELLETQSSTLIKPSRVENAKVEDKDKKKRRKKRHNKPPKDTSGKIDPQRWQSKKKKKKQAPAATGFGSQGSSNDSKSASLQHQKGQSTLLKPEQVLANKMKGKGIKKKR